MWEEFDEKLMEDAHKKRRKKSTSLQDLIHSSGGRKDGMKSKSSEFFKEISIIDLQKKGKKERAILPEINKFWRPKIEEYGNDYQNIGFNKLSHLQLPHYYRYHYDGKNKNMIRYMPPEASHIHR